MTTKPGDWILAARPKTLTAAAIPVVVGSALAWSDLGVLHWRYSILALIGALFIQIATNLINDALDFEKGTDDEHRVGPRRVTASGLISPAAVKRAAWISFAIAAAAGVPLIFRGGWPLLAIGLTSILAGYLYTGGPYPLAYHGLGEIFVIFFFGIVAVAGTYYLQALRVDADPLIAGLAVGLLSTVLLAVNNLRDVDGDARSNKKTLAVRFGRMFARAEIALCALLPLALGVYWWTREERAAALMPLLLFPLVLSIMVASARDSGPALNRTLGKAAGLHALYGILLSIGLIIR
jgi:1,4-dihydroxy-2-naphthoate octaprenyltransferase